METPFRKAEYASSCRTLTGVRRKLQPGAYLRGSRTTSTNINVKRVIKATLLIVAATVQGAQQESPPSTPQPGALEPGDERPKTPEECYRGYPPQEAGLTPAPEEMQCLYEWHSPVQDNDDEKRATASESGPLEFYDDSLNEVISEYTKTHTLTEYKGRFKDDVTSIGAFVMARDPTLTMAEAMPLKMGTAMADDRRTKVAAPRPRRKELPRSEYGKLHTICREEDKQIQEGSYATIHRAPHECVKRFKLPFDREISGERNVKCMIREMWLMTYLKHDNILSLRNIPKLSPLTYENMADMHMLKEEGALMTMELMQMDLRYWIRSRLKKETPVELIMDIASQILKGLHYLHSAKVMHRDLSPSNILLSEITPGSDEWRVKICDFGMSRYIGDEDKSLTPKVTHSYRRAPEVWNYEMYEKVPYDFSADLYSVGCIIAEMLVSTPSKNLTNGHSCKPKYFLSENGVAPKGDDWRMRLCETNMAFITRISGFGQKDADKMDNIKAWLKKNNKYREFTDDENDVLALLGELVSPNRAERMNTSGALETLGYAPDPSEFDVDETAGFEVMEQKIDDMYEISSSLASLILESKLLTAEERKNLVPHEAQKLMEATNLIFAGVGISECRQRLEQYQAKQSGGYANGGDSETIP